MINRKLGRITELNCCRWLRTNGWWCHRMAQTEAGQPCDIVALKGNDCILIDAKHCDKPYLATSRIEPNQRTCFKYANERFGIKCGFMCEWDGKLFFLDWNGVDLRKASQPLDPAYYIGKVGESNEN